jgi:hypothetical protein
MVNSKTETKKIQGVQEESYTGKTTVHNICENKLMKNANNSDLILAYPYEMQ